MAIPRHIRRRDFVHSGLVAAGALALGPSFWRDALSAAGSQATPGPGPYGPLLAENANGIRLPQGFRSRVIARANQMVPGTSYEWHVFPDGQATYETEDGGFILVSNCEFPDAYPGQGGASAIRFRADGSIADAYRILSGTTNNCAGGKTPWSTWMSCEETDGGRVWECDPTGKKPAVVCPAMGAFEHEAVCVDPVGRRLYLTEDHANGRFYRFTPERYPDCSSGLLEVATVNADRVVSWTRVPDPSAGSGPTRTQVPGSTPFRRGEGIWFDSGVVYLCTTSDNRVHAYNTGTQTIDVLYDGAAIPNPPLKQVDNVTVSPSGDLFVCEDPGDIGVGIITPEGEVARFLQVTGAGQIVPEGPPEDVQNEITGVVFDPSGRRMFFSAQRSFVFGVVYEVTGPFRLQRPPDRRAPQLRLDVPQQMALREVERRGAKVGFLLGEPATVIVALRANLAGPDGKRRRVTLARRVLTRGSIGPVVLRLRLRSAVRRRIRRLRSLRAEVVFQATDPAGNRTILKRDVRLSR